MSSWASLGHELQKNKFQHFAVVRVALPSPEHPFLCVNMSSAPQLHSKQKTILLALKFAKKFKSDMKISMF